VAARIRPGRPALGWTLFFTSKNSCPAIDVRVSWPAGGSYDNCASWRSGVMKRLEALPGLQGVFVGRFAGYTRLVVLPDGTRSEPENVTEAWRAGTSRSLDHLAEIAPRVVLIRDSPWPGKDVPACLSEHPRSPQNCDFELQDGLRDDALLLAEKAAARGRPAVSFLDFTDSICPGDPCRVVGDDGTIKYRDHEHLTGTFAAQLSDDVQQAITPTLGSDLLPGRS
jgi:hypothetical protein